MVGVRQQTLIRAFKPIGAKYVLAGCPHAGKKSLKNKIFQGQRIVTSVKEFLAYLSSEGSQGELIGWP